MNKFAKPFVQSAQAINRSYRNTMLKFYENCEQRAIAMRQREEYREEYDKHVGLSVFLRQVDHLTKKKEKRELNEKEKGLLTQVFLMADEIASQEEHGPYKNKQVAVEIKEKTFELMPELKMIAEMESMIDAVLHSAEQSPQMALELKNLLQGA